MVGHDNAMLLATRYLFAPELAGPCTVEYLLPAGWGLHHPAGARALGATSFEYPSFAALLDTPVVAGRFDARSRTNSRTAFHFIFLDRCVGFDAEVERFADDLMKIAEECRAAFGAFPFDGYSFVFTFNPLAHWGLEHANATTIALPELAFIDPAERAKALRVCAHELFHAWNVCRLKPRPLGAPDFDRGSFPEALWVSEGLTRYYEFVLCARAGVYAPAAVVSNLVNYFRQLAAMPAYARVSLLDSSRATFLNHNKFPGSVNTTIDYYDKGMLVAFDLDVALRTAQRPTTLDATFAAFYGQKAGQGDGFSHEEAVQALSAGDRAIAAALRKATEEPAGLSTVASLEKLGFRVRWEESPFLGIVMAETGAAVANLPDDGPAGRSGLAAGDEILRVNGFPYAHKALTWMVAHEKRLRLEVKRGHQTFAFEIAPELRRRIAGLTWEGNPAQRERVRAWLGGAEFTPQPGEAIPLSAYDNFHGIQTAL
jgi:predicted metalloprotease with PDZ domain